MPISILEALACNIPVICSNLPGTVEFNEIAQQRGLEPPLVLTRAEDPDDLARVVEELLSRPNKNIQTRDYIQQYYGVETHSRAWWVTFGRALERFTEERSNSTLTSEHGVTQLSHTSEFWSASEIEQLRWLAQVAFRLRNSRWFPLVRKLAKFL